MLVCNPLDAATRTAEGGGVMDAEVTYAPFRPCPDCKNYTTKGNGQTQFNCAQCQRQVPVVFYTQAEGANE